MKPKNLGILTGAVIVLGLVFFQSDRSMKANRNDASTKLFSSADGERVSKIVVERGAGKTELSKVDNIWRVADRSAYQASPTKVRALLLKVFDLSVSQKITDQPSSFDSLGVDTESVKTGHTHLTLEDDKGNSIGGLYIGGDRRVRKDAPASGQYIRRDGQNDVYLILDALNVGSTPQSWIDQELFSVPAAQIRYVKQTRLNPEKEEFVIVGTGQGSEHKFQLDSGERSLESVTLSQIVGGLEAAQISDVVRSTDDSVSNLPFSFQTTYGLQNGLVYTLETAQRDKKSYLKISVRFDQDIVKQVQAEVDEVNKTLRGQKC